ncbi:hypothetical protein Salat_0700200 [Sesamum alatum]|uniref:Uncharacterized protein n=1 Tax=Sesamum alatum TaxID=300844 RepID=A0AAE1YSR1_9LAMI|nr:hypothetical protein Salat_0700200 [Sesamum alatum]
MKEVKLAAHDWLTKILVSMWARHAFDERVKNDHVTNNISESFNNWVGDIRSKPILTLLEGLRSKLIAQKLRAIKKRNTKGGPSSQFSIVQDIGGDVVEDAFECIGLDKEFYDTMDGLVDEIMGSANASCGVSSGGLLDHAATEAVGGTGQFDVRSN